MRLDSHHSSPAVLGKILRAAARAGSFREAAESLADLAEVAISARQVGQIAHAVGDQLRQARDQQVDDFQNHRLVPRTTVAPKLAVVLLDGGRYQTRSEDGGPGVHDPAWREDKVADLVTMSAHRHAQDPHPELPRRFLQEEAVVELVQGLTSQGALADVLDPTAEEAAPLTVVAPAEDLPAPSWPPEPLVRTCQATTAPSEAFGPMVAAEAQRRHFFAAERRALRGDGGRGSGRSTARSSRRSSRSSISCTSWPMSIWPRRRSAVVPARSGSGIWAGPRRAGRGASPRC